jgi:hypothetical protein
MPVSGVARIENIRRMQKRRALHADFNERGLHAGQHARDPSLVDIADEAAAAGALDEEFLQHAVLDDRGARLVNTRVDENFNAHVERPPAERQRGTPCRPAIRLFRTAANP